MLKLSNSAYRWLSFLPHLQKMKKSWNAVLQLKTKSISDEINIFEFLKRAKHFRMGAIILATGTQFYIWFNLFWIKNVQVQWGLLKKHYRDGISSTYEHVLRYVQETESL